MTAVSVLFQVVFAVLGVVLLAGGVAALRGRLPGNSWFGVRTPETTQSPEAWTLANRAAAPGFLAAGVVALLGALGLLVVGGWLSAVLAVLAVVVSLGLLSFAGVSGAKAAAIWFENARVTGTLPEGLRAPEVSDSCCSSDGSASDTPGMTTNAAPSGTSAPAGSPASECGVAGGCGSCALKGACTPEAHSSGSVAQ